MNNKAKTILAVITFLGMVVVNALANILPINNTTTGDVSNAYPNLFAPAALTFSIWGVIYALLAAYTIYQTGIFQKKILTSTSSVFTDINSYYITSSVANILWIFSWHYRQIGISVIFMLVILYCLIKIADITKQLHLSTKENFLIRVPFSVYFGWITVATIANITTFLVSINWNGIGLTNQQWMVIILLVGAAIGLVRMLKDSSKAYGLVLIWAYFGIWIKHTSIFASQYPPVITTVLICIGLFILAEGKLFLRKTL